MSRKLYHWHCNECGGMFTLTTDNAPRKCKRCGKSGFMRPEVAEPCSYCGRIVFAQAMLECPACGRPGCCDENGGCMSGGRGCMCPQCECPEDEE